MRKVLIIADYHTHTVFSHGKGTIEENVERARLMGLKEVAITDHGLNHMVFGLSDRKLIKMRKIIDDLNDKYQDIKVLLGVESNIISRSGVIDIKPHEFQLFDIVLCGYHKVVWGKNLTETVKFIGKNDIMQVFNKADKPSLVKANTKTLIESVMNNPIDVLTHPNHDMVIDPVEVAKVARDYGTYYELNGKKINVSDEVLQKIADTGVEFIINSDAHTANRVGEVDFPLEVMKRVGIRESQVANFNKIPKFRSQGR